MASRRVLFSFFILLTYIVQLETTEITLALERSGTWQFW